MKIQWGFAISLIISLLKPIMGVISPKLRTELEEFLKDYYKKAMETENPWDDFLANLLLHIFGVEKPK